MAWILHASREIVVKLVYYGPALSGKTTNLVQLHRSVREQTEITMYSLDTAQDRTLFFDLLPFELGVVRGYKVKMQLYTVPGQSYYASTRRKVLDGVSGVVFVADSGSTRLDDNRESLDELASNLEANGVQIADLPLVIQYNKRDLDDALPVEQLEATLNPDHHPSFGSIAIEGSGVLETYRLATRVTVQAALERLRLLKTPEDQASVDEDLERELARFRPLEAPRAGVDAGRERIVTAPEGPVEAAPPPPGQEETTLIERAVEAHMRTVDLLSRLEETKQRLEHQVRELSIIGQAGQGIVSDVAIETLLRRTLEEACSYLGARGASLILQAAGGSVDERFTLGLDEDPLHTLWGDELLLKFCFHQGEHPVLSRSDLDDEEIEIFKERFGSMEIAASLLRVANHPRGILTFAFDDRPLGGDAIPRFVPLLATQIAIALENRRLYDESHAARERVMGINEFTRAINRSLDQDALIRTVTGRLPPVLGASCSAIYRFDESRDLRLASTSHSGIRDTPERFAPDALRDLLAAREPLVLSAGAPPLNLPPPMGKPAGRWIAIPFRARSEPLGVVFLGGWLNGVPPDESIRLAAATVGEHLGSAFENAHMYARAVELAKRDGLTGLYTHRLFQELLGSEIYRARRYNHKLSLVMVDLDHFKRLNDTFGHQAGDEVLRQVSGLFSDLSRKSDILARYGGEELAVILPETDLDDGRFVAERNRQALEALDIPYEDQILKVTASFGVSSYQDGVTPGSLVRAADAALYEAKARGRNRVAFS